MDTKVREPIFKVGDTVTYKSIEKCGDKYYYDGSCNGGNTGVIKEYNEFIISENCYKIRVTHPYGTYNMLESEFVEYDEKIKALALSESVKIKDLVAGEIYVQANGKYIFKHKTGYAINPSDGRFFDGMWSDNDFKDEFSCVEPATPQQKRWLEYCISKRCFVPIESVTLTKKVEELAYPDVVHCTTKEQVDAINKVLGSKGILDFCSGRFYYLLARKGFSSSKEAYTGKGSGGNPYVIYEFEDIIFPETVMNTYGLSVGDKLPEQIIRKWSEIGQNRLDADEFEWKQQTAFFCGDRTIKSFKKHQNIVGFEVSGTSTVYLRAEGFKEFMEKEMSEKNPINAGDYVVFLKRSLGGNGFKIGDVLQLRNVTPHPTEGFSISYHGSIMMNYWTSIKDGCKVFKSEIEAKQFVKQLLESVVSDTPKPSKYKFQLGDRVEAIDGVVEGYTGIIIGIDPKDDDQSYLVQFMDWEGGSPSDAFSWGDLIGTCPDDTGCEDCEWCRESELRLVDEVVEVKTTTSELKPGIYFKYNIGDRVKISSISIIGTIVRLDYDYDIITDSNLCYLVHFPGFGQGVTWNHHISDKVIGKTFEGDTSKDYLWCSTDDIEKTISKVEPDAVTKTDTIYPYTFHVGDIVIGTGRSDDWFRGKKGKVIALIDSQSGQPTLVQFEDTGKGHDARGHTPVHGHLPPPGTRECWFCSDSEIKLVDSVKSDMSPSLSTKAGSDESVLSTVNFLLQK